jgi:hypothetical protein
LEYNTNGLYEELYNSICKENNSVICPVDPNNQDIILCIYKSQENSIMAINILINKELIYENKILDSTNNSNTNNNDVVTVVNCKKNLRISKYVIKNKIEKYIIELI